MLTPQERSDLASFRLRAEPFWHEGDTDETVAKSMTFQWWVAGERMRDLWWVFVDSLRPLCRRLGVELRTDPRIL